MDSSCLLGPGIIFFYSHWFYNFMLPQNHLGIFEKTLMPRDSDLIGLRASILLKISPDDSDDWNQRMIENRYSKP